LGALTLVDWRTESESLERSADGESSKDVEHLVLDDDLIEQLREHYDPTEIVVAMYQLYDAGLDHRDAQAVEKQIRDKWEQQKPQQQVPSTLVDDSEDSAGGGCVVCMERRVDCLILPCKHMVSCGECSALLKECPMCRGPIAQLVTGIFMV
jgi:hypothetical protein